MPQKVGLSQVELPRVTFLTLKYAAASRYFQCVLEMLLEETTIVR